MGVGIACTFYENFMLMLALTKCNKHFIFLNFLLAQHMLMLFFYSESSIIVGQTLKMEEMQILKPAKDQHLVQYFLTIGIWW